MLEFITDDNSFFPVYAIDQLNQQSVQMRKHLCWAEVMQEMEIHTIHIVTQRRS
jgi:hypothetical protein